MSAPADDSLRFQPELDLIFAAHREGLVRMIRRMCESDADADEVVQDAFVKLHIHSLRTGMLPRNPRAWLATVAHNKMLDLFQDRRHSRKLTSLSDDKYAHPYFEPEPAPIWEQVKAEDHSAAIQQLAPRMREAYELLLEGNRTHSESARLLNVPVGTFRKRIHDARKALDKILRAVVAEESR